MWHQSSQGTRKPHSSTDEDFSVAAQSALQLTFHSPCTLAPPETRRLYIIKEESCIRGQKGLAKVTVIPGEGHSAASFYEGTSLSTGPILRVSCSSLSFADEGGACPAWRLVTSPPPPRTVPQQVKQSGTQRDQGCWPARSAVAILKTVSSALPFSYNWPICSPQGWPPYCNWILTPVKP